MWRSTLLFIVMASLCLGCIPKIAENTLKRIKPEVDSLAETASAAAVAGAIDQLVTDSTKIQTALGSVLQQLQDSVKATIVDLKFNVLDEDLDSLIDERIESAGASLRLQLDSVLLSVDGEVDRMLDNAIDKIKNVISIDQLRAARDTLLGSEMQALTDSLIASAVRTAMSEIQQGYQVNLEPEIDETLKKTEEALADARNQIVYIIIAIAIAVVVVAAIIYYIKRQSNRHKDTVGVLSQAIDKIPDQGQYDELIGRIKNDIQQKGLRQHLDGLLKKENLYQQSEWANKNLLGTIVKTVKDAPEGTSREDLMKQIEENVKNAGQETEYKKNMGDS